MNLLGQAQRIANRPDATGMIHLEANKDSDQSSVSSRPSLESVPPGQRASKIPRPKANTQPVSTSPRKLRSGTQAAAGIPPQNPAAPLPQGPPAQAAPPATPRPPPGQFGHPATGLRVREALCRQYQASRRLAPSHAGNAYPCTKAASSPKHAEMNSDAHGEAGEQKKGFERGVSACAKEDADGQGGWVGVRETGTYDGSEESVCVLRRRVSIGCGVWGGIGRVRASDE